MDVAGALLDTHKENDRLDINRKHGSQTVPSNNYKAKLEGHDMILEGRGEGHGVGVCQKGIIELARGGADFRALLSHYLPQTRTR